MPALGFGTSPMTGGLNADTVLSALRAGYRHIDTARKYGTEPAVGEALRAAGVARGDIFLTTKVSHENLRADDFARSVDASLAALKVDYVDLLMVHWPNPEIAPAEYMPALAKAKRQGLARHIGVANFTTTLLDEAVALCPEPLVALQAEYHPYLDQSKLLAAARRHGLVFVAYCPLGRGRLFDDPGAGRDRAGARTQRRAGGVALAHAAGRRPHPVLVQARAHRRQFRRVRFHAERGRDEPHRRAQARRRPHRQSGRPRARRLGLEGWRPGLESNQAWKSLRGFCVATPPPGHRPA